MAQQEVKIDPEKLSCSICSELLKDPVTIPCGHSYCMSCISRHWDQETRANSFSCPMCRTHFSSRPGLVKNTVLADLVEDLRETQAAEDDCLPGPQDVACDVCTVRKRRASKSCMQCMVSYCEEHLQPHYGDSPLKKHKLMEPSESLQESICSQHNKVKDIFCRRDQKCICYLCLINKHMGHETVPAEEEMTQIKNNLEAKQQTINQRVQELEENITLLEQELQAIKESADQVVSEIKKKLQNLIKNSSQLIQKIRKQQKIEVSRVQEMLTRLQQELAKERKKTTELEQLLDIDTCIEFLKKWPSLMKWKNHHQKSSSMPAIHGRTLRYFQEVSKAVSALNHSCMSGFNNVEQTVTEVDVLLPQNPKTNEEFLQYSVLLSLDQNTANKQLILSEGNRKVTSVREEQTYPPHAQRFLEKAQVLSTNALPARCYWEVDWTGLSVIVGVTYNDIKREGPESGFGSNDKSWVIECPAKRTYTYKHNGEQQLLSACHLSRVGVFLDHKAGILSFYEVSETNKLIHRVQTKFTQPLYAGLGVYYYGATVRMCVKEAPEPQQMIPEN